MALSNWDTLAIDQDNDSIDGTIKGFTEPQYSLQIYKNWIYVLRDGEYVGQIVSGEGYVGDIFYYVERGPSNGVYIFAYTQKYNMDEDGKIDLSKTETRKMLGCGISGYDHNKEDQSDPDGVIVYTFQDGTEEEILGFSLSDEPIFDVTNQEEFLAKINDDHPDNPVVKAEIRNVGTCYWRGVDKEHVDFLTEFYDKHSDDVFEEEKWIPDFEKAQRFNQGDKYFADALGLEVPTTNIAAAETPLIQEMIKALGQEQDE